MRVCTACCRVACNNFRPESSACPSQRSMTCPDGADKAKSFIWATKAIACNIATRSDSLRYSKVSTGMETSEDCRLINSLLHTLFRRLIREAHPQRLIGVDPHTSLAV